ncbi:DUF3455 domain-containing protein [Paraburkholderia phenazinium]|jgi:hypothetical protein|uniref:DUF3455 domain-containing protein n=1 Tax=Paraburkholderia phenazinium TaxID=60549 RepID=A0A1N6H764_9BURK|nr:DUF3455 domain-containing protein [Paraburkholderia phenazinium]SIO15609.1 Protein of unknown function [Paraburkholderia phenazinium]
MYSRFASRRSLARVVTGASLALACSAAWVSSAFAQSAVPAALAPSDATHVIATLKASGTQIYLCKRDANNKLSWAFKAPSAELYDASGELIVTHSAGPSWAAADGSKITGEVLQQAPSADQPGSIPLLLLRATNAAGPGLLSPVRYVQRLDTHGGVAPTGPCTQEGQEGRSPYIARYVFLG